MTADMTGITRGAKHAVVYLLMLMLVLAGANLFFTAAEVSHLRGAVLASCAFAADLGTVPLPPKPKPSRIGVKLVADSRAQWRRLACPGTLPVPPGYAHWASVYHLPAS